jgi:hypothetical protein
MTSSPSPVDTVRLQEKQRLKRLMIGLLAGSGALHGLTIALGYLQPAIVKLVPPPEIEIVLEERDPIKESDETATSEITTTSGSSGGDETLQVATLNSSEPVSAAESESTPIAQPEELSDQDLVNLDLKAPIDPKKKPNADQTKSSQDGKGNKGNNHGSDRRGLATSTGQGLGTGGQTNGNGGDGPHGQGNINNGGTSKTTTRTTPTLTPTPKPSVKPSEAPVAIVPKPSLPEAPPKKTTPKAPNKNYSYQDKEGERLATGSVADIDPVYDEKGRVIGGKLRRSTGDPELDAAQVRSFQRSLEDDADLRQQIEDNRGKNIRFRFAGEGETEAEREQIRRNNEIMAQQEVTPKPQSSVSAPKQPGIGIPIEDPIPVPDPQSDPPAATIPEAPLAEEPPAPIEPPYKPPVAAPEAPPAYEEPAAPLEPIAPEEPVELPAEPIAPEEPAEAPVEAPAEAPPAEAAPAEPLPAETAP